MKTKTVFRAVNKVAVDGVRFFAAEVAKSTSLRPTVREEAGGEDVEFDDAGGGTTLTVEWDIERPAGKGGPADWEQEEDDERAAGGEEAPAQMIQHYTRTMISLAGNPALASLVLKG